MPRRQQLDADYTMWAGRFFTAAELSRRNFMVTFTFGSFPNVLMTAITPSWSKYRIECISQKKEDDWTILVRRQVDDLFHVFVVLPEDVNQSPKFYIVSGVHIKSVIEKLRADEPLISHLVEKITIPFSEIAPFEGRWNDIPK